MAGDSDVSISDLLHMLAIAMKKRSWLATVLAALIAGTAALFGQAAAASRLLCSLQVDLAHAKSTLGWKPVVGTQEAIGKTVDHFLSQR